MGSLSNASSIEIGDDRLRLLSLMRWAGGLWFALPSEPDVEFELHVGQEVFASGDSLVPATRGGGRYWWPWAGGPWSDGQTVAVEVVVQAGDDGTSRVDDFPVLTRGESVNVRGYTVTVIADNGDTHTVRIAPTAETNRRLGNRSGEPAPHE